MNLSHPNGPLSLPRPLSPLSPFRPLTLVTLVTLLILASPVAQAQGDTTGKAALLYGSNHALTIRAPKGWTLDSRSGRAQGLQTVFYPNGTTWAASPTIMYCQVIPRTATMKDRASLVASDVDRYRASSTTAVIEVGDDIPLSRDQSAQVRRYYGGVSNRFEVTAYIEERTVVVVLVLSCSTPEEIEKALPNLRDLVDSYSFLGDDRENIQRALEAVEDY